MTTQGSEITDRPDGRPGRTSRASHFHCYLLRSLDPKHPHKSYVGFTVSKMNVIMKNPKKQSDLNISNLLFPADRPKETTAATQRRSQARRSASHSTVRASMGVCCRGSRISRQDRGAPV